MIYRRELLDQIWPLLDTAQAIVVTGMRRCGKTFLLRDIYAKIESGNKLFLDLENPLLQRLFEEENYETIRTNFAGQGLDLTRQAWIFLDEVQLVKNLPSVVKYLSDHYQFKFFLSGSASFYLKNLFSESLSGRKFIFELFPLSFAEFLIFKNSPLVLPKPAELTTVMFETIKPLWREYLEFGGFPGVVLANNKPEKERLLSEVFTAYFQHEVEQLADFRKTGLVRDLILLLAENAGNLVNVERLAGELKVSRLTVEAWLAFLEKTYLISLVEPYSKKLRVAIRKAKKVYFVDWGLARQIAGISPGQRLENCVFHLLRLKGKVNYFRKKSGAEIDFILDKKLAVEVKRTGAGSDLNKAGSLARELGLKQSLVATENLTRAKGFYPVFIL
ncbi:hypothetical protein COX59_03990 [Candidatus Beckwithbacteria bacterium CG_4_10_14_0_2_um_filter_47_25]|uniref:ATPase n=2 Tax=Candidatus Beckwithiibacteriota TaxID=1752726 RepID=A0A2H0B3M6_9BACT|nr:MAG: hypothetical protein COX09_02550 [Candidatus Beckwithbacteria bacterium CG23_combo_of_CG06-09_8_20_14_all_47_9]PJA21608.1 MAG: hypothetical protein COX59_03990 [Candidatus Beckwithbacteria bacterium CG_4_10_14_0_2_um_filter_47_25]